MRLRTAVHASHVYSTNDPGIEPLIIDALEEQAAALADKGRSLSPDLSVRPLNPRQSTTLRQ